MYYVHMYIRGNFRKYWNNILAILLNLIGSQKLVFLFRYTQYHCVLMLGKVKQQLYN